MKRKYDSGQVLLRLLLTLSRFGGEEKEKKEEKIYEYTVVETRRKTRYGGKFYSDISNGGPGD